MSLSRVSALLLAALFGLTVPASLAAANPLDVVDEDDREALDAFALYPEDVREQALLVATEPALLVQLQELQEDSQDDFKDLVGPYSQDDQQDFFELSRYPDLVEAIARGGPKSRGDLERLSADYPEEVRAAAVRQGGERHRVVSRIHGLLADFDNRFARLIEDLPGEQQQAFRGMLRTPELLSLMTEHMDMTVLLGDAFERDPGDVRGALADLNLEVARRNAEEADDWKQKVESDPDLRRDYEAAAVDYQRDTGYSAYQAPARPVVSISINPYPYWVGYPWWYPVAYDYYDPWYWWYPRPYWGHLGYYYGPRVAIYGGPFWRPWYPSFAFTSWYFSFGHHHHRYPYLSDRFYSHYWNDWDDDWDRRGGRRGRHHHDVHRRVVQKFVYRTDVVMPDNYFRGKNRKDRIERFREYGKVAPSIEKRVKEERRKEFAGKARMRPGRDFDITESGRAAEVGRAEARKLVAKSPKEFPTLSKATTEEWERPRGKGRGKEAAGGGLETGRGGEPKARGKDKEKGSAALPGTGGGEADRGSKGRGTQAGDESPAGGGKAKKGRSESGKAAPTFESPSQGKGGGGKSKAREVQPADESPAGGGKAKKGRSDSGKAAPSFERPSDEGGGGGGNRSRSIDRGGDGGRGKSSTRGGGGEAAPSFEGSKGGSSQRSSSAPEGGSKARSREAEPQRQRSYEAPRAQQPTPRVERSGGGGGGGEGGGRGDGGGKKKKSADEEAQEGGGGGGRGKNR